MNKLAEITLRGIAPALRGDRKTVIRICDARPYVNALGNALAGKGFEADREYKRTELVYANIENIHFVRDSFNNLPARKQQSTKLILSELKDRVFFLVEV
jgi:myotubularin-related protein 1/2